MTGTDYASATLTVYPFSDALARALQATIDAERKRLESNQPNVGAAGGGDLVTPAPNE